MFLIQIILFILLSINTIRGIEFLDPDEITNGMKGYGLTVFQGWEPEQFEVEIVDVMKNVFPRKDMILAKVSGKNLDKTGVIAGMSGSPVFINNKLIGAIAYTWTFTKEPICGITPIKNIISEKYNSVNQKNSEKINYDNFRKIITPISISGFHSEVEKYLKEIVNNKFNNDYQKVIFVPTGNIKNSLISSNTNITLKPGDAIAINFIEGDYNLQGIGTVTYVSNNDIFIFGHPMDLYGNIKLPISKAYIFSIIPTYELSFKLGASSPSIGSTIYDGSSSVYCKLGEKPTMIPVSVSVNNANKNENFNFRIVNDKNYFSDFAVSGILSSILSIVGFLDDKRIIMNFLIEIENNNKIYKVSKSFKYNYNPSYFNFYALFSDLYRYLNYIQENTFTKINILNLNVDIKIENGLSYYYIENCILNKFSFYTGENIYIKTFIKNYKNEYLKENFVFKIPEDLETGTYRLIIGNDIMLNTEIYKSYPKYFSIYNLEQFLNMISISEDINTLNIALLKSENALTVKDKKMFKFPKIYSDFFDQGKNIPNPLFFPKIYSQKYNYEQAIYGVYTITLNIIKKNISSSE